jgi:uncharacterized membrane protein
MLQRVQACLRFDSSKETMYWLVVASIAGFFPLWASAFRTPGARATFYRKGQPYKTMPIALLVHLCGSLPVCVAGVVQFVPCIRKRCLWLHRWNGRVYVVCHCISGAGILMMLERYYHDGEGTTFWPILFLFFGTQGSLLMAVKMVLTKQIQLHRQWMLRNYAWNTCIITLRFIFVPILLSGTFNSNNLVAQRCDIMTGGWDPDISDKLLDSTILARNECNTSNVAYFKTSPALVTPGTSPLGANEPLRGPNPAAANIAFGSMTWIAWVSYRLPS